MVQSLSTKSYQSSPMAWWPAIWVKHLQVSGGYPEWASLGLYGRPDYLLEIAV